ncbi:MAG: class I SAM-dependent DNA methyltransferase [Rhodoglobus sp.]
MESRVDTPSMRKERGAFFTPHALAKFMTGWAVRDRADRVLEPSCGDAIFLRSAGQRLAELGSSPPQTSQLRGFDIHNDSLEDAARVLSGVGLTAELIKGDFFGATARPAYDAVVGNPPFIRFQGFAGESRRLANDRAALSGVDLSGLASSWAAFVVHGATFLKPGGRLGLVLPAELMSVNYAAPVRRFLLERFGSLDLVVFDELIFAGVQADVVVLLADGYGLGSAGHFRLHSANNVEEIDISEGRLWRPNSPSDRWTDAIFSEDGASLLRDSALQTFAPLQAWGRTTSGIVTGANAFFTMTEDQAADRGLGSHELLPVLPAGTSFSSRASLSGSDWARVAKSRPGYLFAPSVPTKAALKYIGQGEKQGLDLRYKCRIRAPWWKVPLGTPSDLFVSYMSGSTPRIVSNRARVLNLNSVHGLRVAPSLRPLAQMALPVMAMSSVSLLSAELVGRTYGGGILKLEPTEAARWLVPRAESMKLMMSRQSALLSRGRYLLSRGDTAGCTAIADEILMNEPGSLLTHDVLRAIQNARNSMVKRRATRAASKS